jgi:nitrate reductase NapAB chaperone NapD
MTPPTGECAQSQKEKSMPVFSYLAYPKDGRKKELIDDLAGLKYCEIMPSDNQDILILVTDTPDEATEKELQKILKHLKSLESLGMTFGHTDG